MSNASEAAGTPLTPRQRPLFAHSLRRGTDQEWQLRVGYRSADSWSGGAPSVRSGHEPAGRGPTRLGRCTAGRDGRASGAAAIRDQADIATDNSLPSPERGAILSVFGKMRHEWTWIGGSLGRGVAKDEELWARRFMLDVEPAEAA